MKKGFTLIELLAVIVILAIIALIATPIVLNIINDARNSSGLRSAELYISAVEQAVARKNLTKELGEPLTCNIGEEVICNGVKVDVEISKKATSGSITFEKGKVTSVSLTMGNDSYSMVDGKLQEYVIPDSPAIITLNDGSKAIKVSYKETAEETIYVLSDGTEIYENGIITLEDGSKWKAFVVTTDVAHLYLQSIYSMYLEGSNAGQLDLSGTEHELVLANNSKRCEYTYPPGDPTSDAYDFYPEDCDEVFQNLPNYSNQYLSSQYFTIRTVPFTDEDGWDSRLEGWSGSFDLGYYSCRGELCGIHPLAELPYSKTTYHNIIKIPSSKVIFDTDLNIAIVGNKNLPSSITWTEVSTTSTTRTLISNELLDVESFGFSSNEYEGYEVINLTTGNLVGHPVEDYDIWDYGDLETVSEDYDENDNYKIIYTSSNLPETLSDKNYYIVDNMWGYQCLSFDGGECTGTRLMVTLPK